MTASTIGVIDTQYSTITKVLNVWTALRSRFGQLSLKERAMRAEMPERMKQIDLSPCLGEWCSSHPACYLATCSHSSLSLSLSTSLIFSLFSHFQLFFPLHFSLSLLPSRVSIALLRVGVRDSLWGRLPPFSSISFHQPTSHHGSGRAL